MVGDVVLGSGGSKSRRTALPQSALSRLLDGAVFDVALGNPSDIIGVGYVAHHSTGCSQFWGYFQPARET